MPSYWRPRSEPDIQRAIDDALLSETHYLDCKREIGAAPGARKETARDLASFDIDGSALLIGVDEDKANRTSAWRRSRSAVWSSGFRISRERSSILYATSSHRGGHWFDPSIATRSQAMSISIKITMGAIPLADRSASRCAASHGRQTRLGRGQHLLCNRGRSHQRAWQTVTENRTRRLTRVRC